MNSCPIISGAVLLLLFGLDSSFTEENIQLFFRGAATIWFVFGSVYLAFAVFPIFITVSYTLLRNELDVPDVEELDELYKNETHL